jgi:HEAT repeat protein
MKILDKILGRSDEPTERQLRRALKQATQIHGDAAPRVAALERLAGWATPEAAAALLRRFTVQVPQGSMDLEEKQYTVRLLAGIGRAAVGPILQHLRTEPDVTFPAQALREILPAEEFYGAIVSTLSALSAGYSRWPEAKTVLISMLPDEAYPQVRDTILGTLEDDNDDVCIAAADYLARNGDDEVRERLLEVYLAAESRPRVRGAILGQFCEREWPVKGYRKRVEETITEPFYMTSKGTVKRRPQ